ncbi:MAG TPA: DUF4198 domain-containing protein [Leeuwenhoekiella sp.]|nr:DUF4198 domain-containing protein [Leeuwenhoekiella sp.]
MKTKTQVVLCLFLIGNIAISSAHALFIKTETKGTKDQSHKVTIFYAEPAEGKKEQLKDWWSNTKDFSLWLIQPDGTKKQLEVTPNNNHFAAAFTPSTEGAYHLAIYHDVAQTFDATQYQFNASATIHVGNVPAHAGNKSAEGLFLRTNAANKNKVNAPLEFTIIDAGKPVAEVPVTFFAPNGWTKTITTNAQGKVAFTPLWDGNYLIETYKVDEVENQAEFNKKHRIVTTVLKVE